MNASLQDLEHLTIVILSRLVLKPVTLSEWMTMKSGIIVWVTLSYDILGRLSSQEIVRGIPKIKPISSVVCGHCQEGKIVKTSHKKVKDIHYL